MRIAPSSIAFADCPEEAKLQRRVLLQWTRSHGKSSLILNLRHEGFRRIAVAPTESLALKRRGQDDP